MVRSLRSMTLPMASERSRNCRSERCVPLSYFNPFQQWGSGIRYQWTTVTLNVFDNPDIAAKAFTRSTAYNIGSFNIANRTIANAIKDYGVPAGRRLLQWATQWRLPVCEPTVAPARNQPYTIQGFLSTIPGTVTRSTAACPPISAVWTDIISSSNVPKAVFPVDGPGCLLRRR